MAAWDGQGRPPSEAAAYDWMVDNGVSFFTARRLVQNTPLSELGDAAREAVERGDEASHERSDDDGGLFDRVVDYLTPGTDAPAHEIATEGLPTHNTPPPLSTTAIGGQDSQPSARDEAVAQIHDNLARFNAQIMGFSPEQVDQILATEGGEKTLEQLIAKGPNLGMAGQGAPLLPPSIGGVADAFKTRESSTASYFGSVTAGEYGSKRGARYHEKDLLEPWKWSREDRASVQRIMAKIGLYAALDARPRLGSWGELDSQVFAELLTTANVEGRTWRDQLATWSANPPQDLQRLLRQQRQERKQRQRGPNEPTYRVSNPMEIQDAVRATSQQLLGRVVEDPNAVVDPSEYQQQEIALQQQGTADQRRGGGGVYPQLPSPGALAERSIREDMPLEVDAYQFMNQFQGFLSMLGGP